eukprot:scaffold23156_cov20-Tisochrysis_lutea.AAC.5
MRCKQQHPAHSHISVRGNRPRKRAKRRPAALGLPVTAPLLVILPHRLRLGLPGCVGPILAHPLPTQMGPLILSWLVPGGNFASGEDASLLMLPALTAHGWAWCWESLTGQHHQCLSSPPQTIDRRIMWIMMIQLMSLLKTDCKYRALQMFFSRALCVVFKTTGGKAWNPPTGLRPLTETQKRNRRKNIEQPSTGARTGAKPKKGRQATFRLSFIVGMVEQNCPSKAADCSWQEAVLLSNLHIWASVP